jgi:hypothetical protein
MFLNGNGIEKIALLVEYIEKCFYMWSITKIAFILNFLLLILFI